MTMGVMIDGQYFAEDPAPESASDGEFRRKASSIRDWIGQGNFAPEAGRYHLFVAWNCPWAHRALLTRAVLGLEDANGIEPLCRIFGGEVGHQQQAELGPSGRAGEPAEREVAA